MSGSSTSAPRRIRCLVASYAPAAHVVWRIVSPHWVRERSAGEGTGASNRASPLRGDEGGDKDDDARRTRADTTSMVEAKSPLAIHRRSFSRTFSYGSRRFSPRSSFVISAHMDSDQNSTEYHQTFHSRSLSENFRWKPILTAATASPGFRRHQGVFGRLVTNAPQI